MQYTSDFALLLDLKKGKEKAFRFCYSEYFTMVKSWLMKNGSGAEDADDLFQESLLVLFDKVKKDDFELNSKLSTYLLSVAKYMMYNKNRKTRGKESISLDYVSELEMGDAEKDIKYFLEQEELYDKLESALSELGSPCKEVLEAYYMDNMSMEDISELMSYTNANNAKTQKYKCLNRLKKIFRKKEKENNEQFRTI